MNKILYFILHPFLSFNLWSDEHREDEGIDVFYALFLCVVAGIWLVVQRERRSKNSPIPFHFSTPKVQYPNYVYNPVLKVHATRKPIRTGLLSKLRDQHWNLT